MTQDTGKFRENTKDQYYTCQSVAKECIDSIVSLIPDSIAYQWIEPSAGNGSFLKSLPIHIPRIGIDLDPKMDGIIKGNFLEWEPTSHAKRIFFGNPPFGKQGSLAKQFIQHSANYADVIAFILPKSFVKPSMSRAFPSKFHCILEKELPKNSFEVNKISYDVPCVFQIWQKQSEDRVKSEPVKEIGFKYTKASEEFHLVIRRVGARAGICNLKGTSEFNSQTHYFLKLDTPGKSQGLMEAVNKHTFPSNTAGPRSLSKSEINEVINKLLVSV